MSGDDIVFGEIRYREPIRARRPDRDRLLACVAYEVPGADDLPIYLDLAPADAIERHALRDTSVELGGILLGHECIDEETGEPFVRVTRSLEAKHYENTQASFTYTHDSWEEITRERDRTYPNLDIVGWYHTHPDFGIFLSSHDLFIHRNFFDQPLQVAYVVDPIRQSRGFFRWKDGGLNQVGGFHLSAPRGDRSALVRLVNDLESLPNAEAGGTGLSPRLEAELIAMLTRPGPAGPSPADRMTTTLLGMILGLVVGVFAVLAVVFAQSLAQQVRDQSKGLHDLGAAVERNLDTQRMALDAIAVSSRSAPGQRATIEEAYNLALAERDRLRGEVNTLQTFTKGLAAETNGLKSDAARARSEADKAGTEAKSAIAEAKGTKQLRSDYAKAVDDLADRDRAIAEKDALLSTVDPAKAASLLFRARWGLYLALAGWSVAALLGVGLYLIWRTNPGVPGEDPRAAGPGPTHLIG